jgi:hypothetical protein
VGVEHADGENILVFSNSGMSLERTAVDVAKRVDLLIGDAV